MSQLSQEVRSQKGGSVTYILSVEEMKAFHEDGFLIVPKLINQEDVQELLDHTVDIMKGQVTVPGQIDPPPSDPWPKGCTPDATAAAVPPLEPPGV